MTGSFGGSIPTEVNNKQLPTEIKSLIRHIMNRILIK